MPIKIVNEDITKLKNEDMEAMPVVHNKDSHEINEELMREINEMLDSLMQIKLRKTVEMCSPFCINTDIENRLDDLDIGFADLLFSYIDKKFLKDSECYKRANVSKKTFSKIRCDKNYKPSKTTATALGIALELDESELNYLLSTLGYTLGNSTVFDVIIQCCIRHKIYSVDEINQILYKYDQPLLGY